MGDARWAWSRASTFSNSSPIQTVAVADINDMGPAGFATRAVHVGQGPEESTGAVVVPLHLATTYAQREVGVHSGYEYSRSGNPTREALEECLASLEGALHALTFSSGLGASTTVLLLLQPGDHVVLSEDVYGGTFRLVHRVFGEFGLTHTMADTTDAAAVRQAIRERTRLLWLESPTNPLLRVADIRRLSQIAREAGAMTLVDSTFATPYLQRPLDLGADIVLHSSTKYLGGHSDVVGGAVLTNDADIAERLRFLQNAAGAVPSPFDCWLLLRGLKTLALRMERHCSSALEIARHLEKHPAVRRIHYPGLPAHPQHDLARTQMSAFGGMVSFEVRDEAAALEILRQLRIFTLAESLGAVESLAEHPGRMTHASIPAEQRARLGLSDALVRLSVGIEDVEDLKRDLDQALDAVR
jgi:cystathionine beta-lyase/cystathionine gamma-synthase